MNTSLDKVAPPVAFVVVGFTMAIAGATGVVPLFSPPLVISNSILQTIFVILGVVLVMTGPVLFWRQVTSSSEDSSEKATRGQSKARLSSPAFYGIRVLKPGDDEYAGNSFEVIGTYENLPKGSSIWICTYSGEGENREYWPQHQRAEIDYDGKKGSWKGWMGWLGGNKGDPEKFLVFVTGEDGDALFSYFKKAGEENKHRVQKETGYDLGLWPSITKLTKDTILCSVVRVRA